MPQAIPIVAALVVKGAAIEGMKAAVIMIAASAAAASLSAQEARRKARRAAWSGEARERQHIVRSSIQPHRVIYGQVPVSGVMAFAASSGSNNEYVHLVLPLAGHPVEEIGEIYIDDTPLTGSKYAPYVRVKKHLGDPDQLADADLVAECDDWTDNHRLRGIAYIYVRLHWPAGNGADIWPTGLPQIKAMVKGKQLFDPRTGLSAYSDNWALCVRDYLTSSYGLGCASSEIDDALMITAANICDEVIDPGPLADLATVTHDWQFKNSAQSFSAVNASLVTNPEYLVLAHSAVDGQLWGPVDLSFSGATNRFVRLMVRRVSGAAWDGKIFYHTAGHTFSGGFYANIPEIPIDGQFHYIEVDMWALAAGGDDWKNSAIERLRFDFAEASPAVAYIKWIMVGNREDQLRYTCNGSIELGNNPAEVIERLISAGAGALCYSQGLYKLSAGAYTAPVGSLDESDLRGEIKVRPRPPRAELANGIRGTFISPADSWQPVDFPPVVNPLYVAEDGGEEILHDLELPFTIDPIAAQRIAKLQLERGRQGIVVEFPANYRAMQYIPGDTLQLSVERLGWVNKEFRIIDWRVAAGGAGVDLTLQEEAAAVYDWNYGAATKYDAAPDTQLQDARICNPPTNLTVQSGNNQLFVAGDGTVVSRMLVTWAAPADAFVVGYEVEYQQVADADWIKIPSTDLSCLIGPVQDGQRYNLRVRAVNSLGVRSSWLTYPNHTVIGKTQVPPAPSTFTVARQPDGTREFSAVYNNKPADHAGFLIRYQLGQGGQWANMTDLNTEGLITAFPYESNQLAAGDYTFAIAAVDTSGLISAPLYIETTLADPRIGSVAYSEYPESQGWPGTKTDCQVDNNSWLEAISDTTWDTAPATWDGYTSWNQGARSPIVYQHPTIDIGFDLVFTPLISFIGEGNPTIEVDWSSDNVTWNGWALPQLITARYLRVRITVTGAAPLIKSLPILLSADVITEEINDLSTAGLTGAYRIGVGDIRLPITKGFTKITQVQLALQSVGAGWSWELVDKDASVGPHVRIYNATPAAADCTLDAFIRGL